MRFEDTAYLDASASVCAPQTEVWVEGFSQVIETERIEKETENK